VLPDCGATDPIGDVSVKTYRDVLLDHGLHPEVKAMDATSSPCTRGSQGRLARRATGVATTSHIGKEAHRLDELRSGLISDYREVSATYVGDKRELLAMALQVLGNRSTGALASARDDCTMCAGDAQSRDRSTSNG
jgi:hypothetical protein